MITTYLFHFVNPPREMNLSRVEPLEMSYTINKYTEINDSNANTLNLELKSHSAQMAYTIVFLDFLVSSDIK